MQQSVTKKEVGLCDGAIKAVNGTGRLWAVDLSGVWRERKRWKDEGMMIPAKSDGGGINDQDR